MPRPSWRHAPLLLAPLALRFPRLTRGLTAAHTTVFLRTQGQLTSRWFGAAVLVLETVGRRTGKPRATPVVYLPDGENLVVVAANGGADGPPAWWLNLRAAGEGVAGSVENADRSDPRKPPEPSGNACGNASPPSPRSTTTSGEPAALFPSSSSHRQWATHPRHP
jgi:hypothetical protein